MIATKTLQDTPTLSDPSLLSTPTVEVKQDKSSDKVFYILRGLPGSGKSTLAKSLVAAHVEQGNVSTGTVILSADDYFTRPNGEYRFDPTKLQQAHAHCLQRAKNAFLPAYRYTCIVLDNTNTQLWEMKRYVEAAMASGWTIVYKEPETPWANNPRECAAKSASVGKHVPLHIIEKLYGNLKMHRPCTSHLVLQSTVPTGM
jgi:predicted kinase